MRNLIFPPINSLWHTPTLPTLYYGRHPLAVSWAFCDSQHYIWSDQPKDCQPHLKAQDEEPHIYEEISRGGFDGTGHPPDGGELSAQEGNPSTTAEIEASVMWLQGRSSYQSCKIIIMVLVTRNYNIIVFCPWTGKRDYLAMFINLCNNNLS